MPRQLPKVGELHRLPQHKHHKCRHRLLLEEVRIAGTLRFKIEEPNRQLMRIDGISLSRIARRKNNRHRRRHRHHKPIIPGEFQSRRHRPYREPPFLLDSAAVRHRKLPPLQQLRQVWPEQAFQKTRSWTDCPMFCKKAKRHQLLHPKSHAGIYLFKSA